MDEKLINSQEAMYKLNDITKRLIKSNENLEGILTRYHDNFSSSVDRRKADIREIIKKQTELITRIEDAKNNINSVTNQVNQEIIYRNSQNKNKKDEKN